MFEQDYIMTLVRDLVRFISKVVLKKDVVGYEIRDTENLTHVDLLHKELIYLITQGKINEAENLLFDSLDTNNTKYLELAIDFYNRLNDLDDDYLEDNDFSRKEIEEGLKAIAKEFGVPL